MGYTHYWKRQKEIPKETMAKIVEDFKSILNEIKNIVSLKGEDGKNEPKITENLIHFNGDESCGHKKINLGIAWPSKDATGISNLKDEVKAGNWGAGALLSTRACGGNCSHEDFYFPQILKETEKKEESDSYFEFCKTAFKPYDLAVTTFLIIAKHHLRENILVSTDGNAKHWDDATSLCKKILKYEDNFEITSGEILMADAAEKLRA